MLRYSLAALLLVASVQSAAAAAPVAPPSPARLDMNASPMEAPARETAQRVAFAQRRDALDELARAVALTVFFRTDSMDVDGQTLARIRLLGGFLRQFPELRVYLDSHSDRRGSNAHNRRLSRARADIIAGVLEDAGIPARRIHGNAWGETQARAATDDAAGLIFDRRVDIQLSLDPET